MAVTTRLAAEGFEPAEELAGLVASLDREGAVVSFVGIARPNASTGEPVERLFLDHHPRLTERSLDAIAADAIRVGDEERRGDGRVQRLINAWRANHTDGALGHQRSVDVTGTDDRLNIDAHCLNATDCASRGVGVAEIHLEQILILFSTGCLKEPD